MKQEMALSFGLLLVLLFVTSCSYNPFISNNHTTGSAAGALVGAAITGGSTAALDASKGIVLTTGVIGGMLGYYLTTLRSDAAEIVQASGKVYHVGDYLGIYVPSDKLFEPNTADLLPQAGRILDSVATVLNRFPTYNIMISGNTSGFYHACYEQVLSEKRAKVVAAYLWKAGINNNGKTPNVITRKLNYVGYGDFFPIAHKFRNEELRSNSRIQIVVYPNKNDIKMDSRTKNIPNVGGGLEPMQRFPGTCSSGSC